MKLPPLNSLMLVLGTGTTVVSARCYGLGLNTDIQWPGPAGAGKAAARAAVERACRDSNGAFQGVFQPNEERYYCEPYADNSFIFKVKNLNQGESFDLNDDDCAFRLQNEINGCDEGGQSTVAGWWFSSDPENYSNCGN